jgi:glycosyltransferase involved in cell wall biosynthesis
MFRQATVIFCKTPETAAVIPAVCRAKSRLHLEIGLEPERIRRETAGNAGRVSFLYAGTLAYSKGVHLALKAFAEVRLDRPTATLALIGSGADEARLRSLAVTLGLHGSVQWLGWIAHKEIWECYSRYTAFVFPSLHDSSGNVLLEAMSQGVPVICLDNAGPGAVVPASCGIKVPVKNRSEAEVVGDLAAAMEKLANDSKLQAQMGRHALEFAQASTWKDVVSSAYADIEDALEASRSSRLDRRA